MHIKCLIKCLRELKKTRIYIDISKLKLEEAGGGKLLVRVPHSIICQTTLLAPSFAKGLILAQRESTFRRCKPKKGKGIKGKIRCKISHQCG